MDAESANKQMAEVQFLLGGYLSPMTEFSAVLMVSKDHLIILILFIILIAPLKKNNTKKPPKNLWTQ